MGTSADSSTVVRVRTVAGRVSFDLLDVALLLESEFLGMGPLVGFFGDPLGLPIGPSLESVAHEQVEQDAADYAD